MLTVENTKAWLLRFAEKVEANKAHLSDLDSVIGDGDHGNNMARGIKAMQEALESKEASDPADVLKNASMALLSKIGGASGPLYGSAFLDMSKQAKEDASDVSAIFRAGLSGIQKRGKAEPGEKTMVDVWHPVIKALESGELTTDTITDAVEATKPLKATKGRASYLGERSIGELDPGAVSSSYLFEAWLEGED
ncbi:dihydroxyacetone kinase DhaL subunit [Pelagirhabdus alkalitolerans]|uniref:phosphoenolpyruvate--glycerone phosphotransferase n=1 Tax=Pelagirhabdus alkalitolerans TaxID=1612202 RepID=A0A1G6KX02_9BACI|nr:dihydroxyacetone kinase subunit DhaL [Pelagirhabdus alkalitolerans]SDC35338.1 dihydroxyacetone kinase DhaL subunit [Pelagirhabdus alkalitolerans]